MTREQEALVKQAIAMYCEELPQETPTPADEFAEFKAWARTQSAANASDPENDNQAMRRVVCSICEDPECVYSRWVS